MIGGPLCWAKTGFFLLGASFLLLLLLLAAPSGASWAPFSGTRRLRQGATSVLAREVPAEADAVDANRSSFSRGDKVNCTEVEKKAKRMDPGTYAHRDPDECLEDGASSAAASSSAALFQNALQQGGRVSECHQCYTSCASEDEAFNQCINAYYLTCDSGKKALSFCRCEQGGWDYPYLNPGGRASGQFSWKCCFSHKCIAE